MRNYENRKVPKVYEWKMTGKIWVYKKLNWEELLKRLVEELLFIDKEEEVLP